MRARLRQRPLDGFGTPGGDGILGASFVALRCVLLARRLFAADASFEAPESRTRITSTVLAPDVALPLTVSFRAVRKFGDLSMKTFRSWQA